MNSNTSVGQSFFLAQLDCVSVDARITNHFLSGL